MEHRSSIRVLVVDDHPVVRLGLHTMLESEPGITAVSVASSGEEALRFVQEHRTDVVLTELRMPGMDGIRTIAALRVADPDVKVVVLTSYHSDEDVFMALKEGAKAYLLKSTPLDEVLGAIRAVHAGECRIPENIATQLAAHVGRPQLSLREQEIIKLVARGMTNREIGQMLSISDKTVRNHVINCMDKLRAKSRTEAVTVAVRRGLITIENSR
jgi:two-component system NarL family response regulator